MRLSAILSLVTLVVGPTVCLTQRDMFAAESETQKDNRIVAMIYYVDDLPVWTSEKKYDPSLLMRLIQASVSPSDWKTERGGSRMTSYPPKSSIVISTRIENHDKISDLLESMRPKK